MILPPPPGDLEALGAMANVAVSAGPTAKDWPYYQFVKGLTEYRQGHFADSTVWLEKVVAQDEKPDRTVQAYAVLAVTRYQLMQLGEARAALAAGRELA